MSPSNQDSVYSPSPMMCVDGADLGASEPHLSIAVEGRHDSDFLSHANEMRSTSLKLHWTSISSYQNIIKRCMSNKIVMSFGDGSQGALGLSSSVTGVGGDAYEPTPVIGLPPDVCSVGAGHYHSLSVCKDGSLWSWGRNNEAQLGRSDRDSWGIPKRVEGLHQVKVAAAYASGVISAAAGDDGSLWVWGKSKRGQLGLGKDVIEAISPSRVRALEGERIAKVSLGWGHALALSEDGKLYGWGYSVDGRLGCLGKDEKSFLDSHVGELDTRKRLEAAEKLVMEGIEKEGNMPIIWEPQLMDEFHGIGIADIACGLDHSLVLCRNGSLLSGGNNVYGQLGRHDDDVRMSSVNISSSPVSIASGLGHSLCICQDAHVESGRSLMSWGWNHNHQLGRMGQPDIPLRVEELEGKIPISVSGGRVHSVALFNGGQVWVWGCGKNGRLGLGSSADEAEPCLLEFIEGSEVVQVAAGFDHNLILVNDS